MLLVKTPKTARKLEQKGLKYKRHSSSGLFGKVRKNGYIDPLIYFMILGSQNGFRFCCYSATFCYSMNMIF